MTTNNMTNIPNDNNKKEEKKESSNNININDGK